MGTTIEQQRSEIQLLGELESLSSDLIIGEDEFSIDNIILQYLDDQPDSTVKKHYNKILAYAPYRKIENYRKELEANQENIAVINSDLIKKQNKLDQLTEHIKNLSNNKDYDINQLIEYLKNIELPISNKTEISKAISVFNQNPNNLDFRLELENALKKADDILKNKINKSKAGIAGKEASIIKINKKIELLEKNTIPANKEIAKNELKLYIQDLEKRYFSKKLNDFEKYFLAKYIITGGEENYKTTGGSSKLNENQSNQIMNLLAENGFIPAQSFLANRENIKQVSLAKTDESIPSSTAMKENYYLINAANVGYKPSTLVLADIAMSCVFKDVTSITSTDFSDYIPSDYIPKDEIKQFTLDIKGAFKAEFEAHNPKAISMMSNYINGNPSLKGLIKVFLLEETPEKQKKIIIKAIETINEFIPKNSEAHLACEDLLIALQAPKIDKEHIKNLQHTAENKINEFLKKHIPNNEILRQQSLENVLMKIEKIILNKKEVFVEEAVKRLKSLQQKNKTLEFKDKKWMNLQDKIKQLAKIIVLIKDVKESKKTFNEKIEDTNDILTNNLYKSYAYQHDSKFKSAINTAVNFVKNLYIKIFGNKPTVQEIGVKYATYKPLSSKERLTSPFFATAGQEAIENAKSVLTSYQNQIKKGSAPLVELDKNDPKIENENAKKSINLPSNEQESKIESETEKTKTKP